MGLVKVNPGVQFAVIDPAGFRLLRAFDTVAEGEPFDLVITSGTDGAHSGPDDPHHLGKAYDVRSHDFPEPQKSNVLRWIMLELGADPQPSSGGLVTDKFFGWIESSGTPNEHYHFQLRKDATLP